MKNKPYFYLYTQSGNALTSISNHVSKFDLGCVGSNRFDISDFTQSLQQYNFPIIVLIGTNLARVGIQIESVLARMALNSEIVVISSDKQEIQNCVANIKKIPLRTLHYQGDLKISLIEQEVIQVMLDLEKIPTYQNNEMFEEQSPREKANNELKERGQERIKASRNEHKESMNIINTLSRDVLQNKKLNEIASKLNDTVIDFDIFSQVHQEFLDKVPGNMTEKEVKRVAEDFAQEVSKRDEGIALINNECNDLEEKLIHLKQQVMSKPNSPEILKELEDVTSTLGTLSTLKEVRVANILGETLKVMINQVADQKQSELNRIEQRIHDLKNDVQVQKTKEGIEKLKYQKDTLTRELEEYMKAITQHNKYVKVLTSGAGKLLIGTRNALVEDINDKVKSKSISAQAYSEAKTNLELYKEELKHLSVINENTEEILTELVAHAKVVNNSLVKIVNVDNVIIASQDNLIKTYEVQGARNTYNLSDRLAVKTLSIIGKNGVGKTATAQQIVKQYQDRFSFLIVDLNLSSPNLHFYYANEHCNNYKDVCSVEGLEIVDKVKKFDNLILIDGTFSLTYLEMILGKEEEGVVESIVSALETLSNIVDKIILIHPEEYTLLSSTLIDRSGELVYVTDANISNMIYINSKIKEYSRVASQLAFQYIIFNKINPKYFNVEIDELLRVCGTDKTKHKVLTVNTYPTHEVSKFRGVDINDKHLSSRFSLWG